MTSLESALFESECGDGADPVDIADGEGAEEFHFILFWDEGETVRLPVIATELREELVGGDTDAGGEMQLKPINVYGPGATIHELPGDVDGVI